MRFKKRSPNFSWEARIRDTSMMSIPMPKIMLRVSSSRIALHRRKHFLHGVGQTGNDRAAYDAVANVEFDQVRYPEQVGEVLNVQSVAGVDPEAQQSRLVRAGDQPLQFSFAPVFQPDTFGKSPGVQFNELAAGARGGFNLRRVGRDEQADVDPGLVQFLARLREDGQLANDVQPPFGGDFLAPLRDKANDVRLELQRDPED